MPTSDDLSAAVAADIITQDQADRLGVFLAARGATAPRAPVTETDDESLRFLRSFQDIFLTVGVVLLEVGIYQAIGGQLGLIAVAAVAFILAFVLARRYRLLLPSMALAVAVVIGCGLAAADFVDTLPPTGAGIAVGAFSAGAAALLFFGIFRLPFALGLAAATIAVGLFRLTTEYARDWAEPMILILGLAIFIVAMVFDTGDPTRRTARSDIAFWLHLVAAPLIVHGTMYLVLDSGGPRFGVADALVVLSVLVVMTLVALVIDRRALMVAGIGYLGFALATLIREMTAGRTTTTMAMVLVALGLIVLALALGWKPLRRGLLAPFPRKGILLRLPPVGSPAG